MKLGLLSAILDTWSLEEVLQTVSSIGYRCVELACWPVGNAERRYAGVSHLDVAALDDGEGNRVRRLCEKTGVELSALAYYPNPLDSDATAAAAAIGHLKNVIDASERLGVGLVNTFIGRDKQKTVEENFERFRAVWPGIIRYAEDKGVRIGIENCPMYFTSNEWPGGANLASSPAIWREMFREIGSDCFGLNYDPSHLYLQGMDYVKPLYEFREKLFHVHFKDLKIYRDKRNDCGIFAYPLDYTAPKLPGLGDIDWSAFVSALYDVGYQGAACVEVEDKCFEGSKEAVLRSVRLAYRYLTQYVQPD